MTLVPGLNVIHADAPHSYSRAHDFGRHTNVALEFWRPIPRGTARTITAPWGETGEADTVTVLGFTFYNPYSARKKSSQEFREWQFGRASAAVYGRPLDLADYNRDDFVPPRKVTRTFRMFLLGGGLALTAVLLVAWLIELPRWHHLGLRPSPRRTAGALVVIVLAGVAVLELYYRLRERTGVIVPLSTIVLMRVDDALPHIGLVAAVAVIPVVAAYCLLRWQFARSEWTGPVPRTK